MTDLDEQFDVFKGKNWKKLYEIRQKWIMNYTYQRTNRALELAAQQAECIEQQQLLQMDRERNRSRKCHPPLGMSRKYHRGRKSHPYHYYWVRAHHEQLLSPGHQCNMDTNRIGPHSHSQLPYQLQIVWKFDCAEASNRWALYSHPTQTSSLYSEVGLRFPGIDPWTRLHWKLRRRRRIQLQWVWNWTKLRHSRFG